MSRPRGGVIPGPAVDPGVPVRMHDDELILWPGGDVTTWLEAKFLAALEHGRDEGIPMRPT